MADAAAGQIEHDAIGRRVVAGLPDQLDRPPSRAAASATRGRPPRPARRRQPADGRPDDDDHPMRVRARPVTVSAWAGSAARSAAGVVGSCPPPPRSIDRHRIHRTRTAGPRAAAATVVVGGLGVSPGLGVLVGRAVSPRVGRLVGSAVSVGSADGDGDGVTCTSCVGSAVGSGWTRWRRCVVPVEQARDRDGAGAGQRARQGAR
jgi:hypothetical protein